MPLRLAVLLVAVQWALIGCASTTSTANKEVSAGMPLSEVSDLLGDPDSRTFFQQYEAWQYADIVGFGQCEYVTIYFLEGVVRSMTSRRGPSVAGCGLGSWPVDWSQVAGKDAGRSGAPPKASGASGSCFFISDDGLAITNHHVIDKGQTFVIVDHQQLEHQARLLKIDPANDLALLKVDNVTTSPLSFAPIGSLATGDQIFSFGHPVSGLLGDEPKFTEGVVSSTTGIAGASNLFQMSVPIQPGSSGAPVVNLQGQVVGVATSTAAIQQFFQATGALPQNINWAVKGEYAQLLAGIVPGELTVISRSQAIEIARRATCQVIVSY